MSAALHSFYSRAFADSAVAMALIDASSLEVRFSNDAFLRFFKDMQVVFGRNVFVELQALSSGLRDCLHDDVRVTCECPQTHARFEFTPVGTSAEDQSIVQCIVTPQAEPTHPRPSDDEVAMELTKVDEGYRRILDHFPQNVWLCTVKGELFWTNRTSNLFTYNKGEFYDAENTRYIAKIHPDDLTGAGIALSRAMNAGRMDAPYRYRLRDHNGEYHWFQFNMAPVLDEQGVTRYWVGTSIDIAAFQKGEMLAEARIAELKQRCEALEEQVLESRQELAKQQKMELVAHLAGGVAHDLNNLLHVMGINIELMQAQPAVAAARPQLRMLEDCIRRAGRLSTQLAGFSGRLPQNATTLEPAALVGNMRELLSRTVGAQMRFSIVVEEGVHRVLADKSYLENALINMAINAREAMGGEGTVRLQVADSHGVGNDGSTADYVMFRVEDEGAGIAPELRERIFDPFFTTKPAGEAAGLGLTMVRSFVESSGGHIEVDSVPGGGTRIALHLPRSSLVPEPAADVQYTPATGGGCILLVEDDEPVREAMHHILSQLGYDIIPSFSVDHAVKLLEGGMRPDLIISDIRMPGRMTINDLIDMVESKVRIPVIFATGYSADVVVREGLIEGRYPVLFKPFSASDIATKVRDALARARDAAHCAAAARPAA